MEFRDYIHNGGCKLDDTLGAWPWTQYRGFVPLHKRPAPPPPDTNEFEHMDLDEDESGSDYELPEGSPKSDESADIGNFEAEDSDQLEALVEEDEVKGLVDETEGWDWNKWRDQQVFDRAIAELEAIEKFAKESYDPDEVVSLITEFYALLVEMGHWPLGTIGYPPHAINVELGKELGYDDHVLVLMQKLPYVNRHENRWESYAGQIVDNTRFADYRQENDLTINGRCPYWGEGQYIESHMLPIAYPCGNHGWIILLDTKLGKDVSSSVAQKYC